MRIREALGEFLVAEGVAPPGDGPEDWYVEDWFYSTVLGLRIPIFPRLGFRQGLPAHDTYHMLNGYPTTWVGECETAAWELATGGCGWHLGYWIDRVLFLAIALVLAPIRSARAWRWGWGKRNLYGLDPEQLLAMDLVEVRRFIEAAPTATD